jgi:hypothetical protein
VIEGSGEIVGVGSFSGPGELSRLLVDNGYVDACAVQHFLTFALGRPASSYEADLLQEMVSSFRAGQHDFKSLMVDFTASDRFARRAEERL